MLFLKNIFFFFTATEAHDDDGLPHTLEHLVFLGSEDYPYKGVLDLLANRCLASGTNAWTDTDNTCYTVTMAGSEGFCNLLPIYLDHVLYPTLPKSGYITEVHHVDENGEDAGVVYCEMQARQNTGESLTYLAMLRHMYPGRCGYKSETGGIIENIRSSTTHKKVCDYHKAFYRSENLCLIITGQAKPEDILTQLKKFENKIISKNNTVSFTKPWQSPVDLLTESVEKIVPYPSDEETHGMVLAAWRGPKAKEQQLVMALKILLEYLTYTAISPLQRDFVELEEPYCSMVKHSLIENTETVIYLHFQSVPKDKLSEIIPRLKQTLEKIASKEEKIDISRMRTVIKRKILDLLNSVETEPHDTLAFILIGDFLFGETKEDLDVRTNPLSCYEMLEKEEEDYWVNLLKTYCIGKPYVAITGSPSIALMQTMAEAEKERLKKQKEALGEEGLKQKEEALKNANKENEIKPSDDILRSLPVPDVGLIQFHPLKPYCNYKNKDVEKSDKFPIDEIPFKFQLDDLHTNFVQMMVLMDSVDIPMDLRYYLPLYLEVLFESPILRDGVIIPREKVIAQLQADTLENHASLGLEGSKFFCGGFPQTVLISLKVQCEKYHKGIQWLKEILYQVQFTEERLKIAATKFINDVPMLKRHGAAVARTVLYNLIYSKDCNIHVNGMLRQHKFLTGLLVQLESDPSSVINKLEKLRTLLTKADNLCVHMAANLKNLSADIPLEKPWVHFLPESAGVCSDKSKEFLRRTSDYVLSVDGVSSKRVIVGIGSEESAYLYLAVPSIAAYHDPDLPALMVLLQYLTQCEGPMWRQIRGLGFSYSYSMMINEESGLLYLVLGRSVNLVEAYKAAQNIVMSYIKGDSQFNEIELESARSSLIFEIIDLEKTTADVSMASLRSYLKCVSHNYNRDMLKKVAQVTLDDLKRVGEKYVVDFFDTNKVRCSVCCHPSKVEEIRNGLKQVNLELDVLPSLDEGFLVDIHE